MMVKKCEHHECRCARAAELMAMADAERNPQIAGQLAHEAIQAHSQKVPCRKQRSQQGEGMMTEDQFKEIIRDAVAECIMRDTQNLSRQEVESENRCLEHLISKRLRQYGAQVPKIDL